MTGKQQQQQQLARLPCYSPCGRRRLLLQLLLLSRRRCHSSCWQAGSKVGCQRAAASVRQGYPRLLLVRARLCGSSSSSGSSRWVTQW
jgi:hypothetical protein